MILFTDDENEDDREPSDDHMKVYKSKLKDLAKILDDIYPPAESHKINEKLTRMGQIPVFISLFFFLLANCCIMNACEYEST